jgi:hypothetical protein
MAGDALPSAVPIHVHIGESYFGDGLTLRINGSRHTPDVSEIALHMRVQVREFVVDSAMLGSFGQSGGTIGELAIGAGVLEFVTQQAAESCSVALLQ